MENLKAILFDLDGVLVDSYEVWFRLMNSAAKDLEYDAITRGQFKKCWGQGVQDDVKMFYTRHTVEQVEAYFNEHFRDHMEHMTLNPDGPTVFAALRNRGMKIAVITNTPATLARDILKEATLSPQVLVGGTDVPHAKPAPDMVLQACDLLGVDPKEALVVGDTKNDADAAKAAGVAFAGLRFGGGHTLKMLRDVLSIARRGEKP